MTERVKLQSLQIENYLGAGSEPPLALRFDGKHALLCGPNGSGKTTVLSALECLKRAFSAWGNHPRLPFIESSGLTTPNHHRVNVWEWADARPNFTADIFHTESEEIRISWVVSVPLELARAQIPLGRLSETSEVAIELRARRDHAMRLETVRLGDQELFRNGSSTEAFHLTAGKANQGGIRYLTYVTPFSELALVGLFRLSQWLLQRIIFFPSFRRPSLAGTGSDVGALAGGQDLVRWVQAASSADPRDAASRRQNALLQEFQEEFAEFAGYRNFSLSVREYSLPLPNNEEVEINATVDGRLRLLSQLGAGIGESLIILLVAKLSQEWQDPPVDIVLLEEPELHIHPSLQRRLLDRLAEYGVQVIAATHSPTVVNWFSRGGNRVFRTEFDREKRRVEVNEVKGLAELRGLIESIGASPADVVLADRVLLVEGSNDVPVFQAWLRKAPSYAGQNVAVLALGGSDAASGNFNPEQWRSLHPKIGAILDSERKSNKEEPRPERQDIKCKLDAVGIRCHLTKFRSTESYFTPRALWSVYGNCPDSLDPFEDPNLAVRGVKQFSKSRNGEVAQAMEWDEISRTDVGEQIESFLKS